MKRRRILRVTIILFLLLILIYPYKLTVMPAADIVVLDEAGRPSSNAVARQEWIDVTVENTQHVDVVKSNDAGHIVFPRRTIRAPLGLRIVNTFWRTLTQGIHASIGSSGSITAYAYGDRNLWAWTAIPVNGDDWPRQMKLQRHDTAIYP